MRQTVLSKQGYSIFLLFMWPGHKSQREAESLFPLLELKAFRQPREYGRSDALWLISVAHKTWLSFSLFLDTRSWNSSAKHDEAPRETTWAFQPTAPAEVTADIQHRCQHVRTCPTDSSASHRLTPAAGQTPSANEPAEPSQPQEPWQIITISDGLLLYVTQIGVLCYEAMGNWNKLWGWAPFKWRKDDLEP